MDTAPTVPALRVTFIGRYDPLEDDFEGKTYFATSLEDGNEPEFFGKRDKQRCGFLYLRSIRTGTRALSLERGSLLDIILRLKEIRPKMWEQTLSALGNFDVGSDPEAGLSGVLESIDAALSKYVPHEWGTRPHLRVTRLTRQHLREVISAFIATGRGEHAAPYYRQGSGTINMLLAGHALTDRRGKAERNFCDGRARGSDPALCSKENRSRAEKVSGAVHCNVAFAVHPRRICHKRDARSKPCGERHSYSSFYRPPREREAKALPAGIPDTILRSFVVAPGFVAEGATEAAALPAVARRLSELNPTVYTSLEGLGITTLDAGSDTQIADLAALYKSLGKETFAVCDHQEPEAKAAIEAVARLFMHSESDIEDLVLKNTAKTALQRFAGTLAWPPHLKKNYPDLTVNTASALRDYFQWSKGNWGLADFLAQCTEGEIPEWLREVCRELKAACEPAATKMAGTQVAAET